MRTARTWSLATTCISAACLMALAPVPAAQALQPQCPAEWLPGHGLPGVNDVVRALTHWDPDCDGPSPPVVVIGGEFTVAGDANASRIAAWDDESGAWQALGAGFNGTVRALLVYDGEPFDTPTLIAGGEFTASGSTQLNRIAWWDAANSSWQPLGTGTMLLCVRALTEYDGKIVAATTGQFMPGEFSHRCAILNRDHWEALGEGFNSAVSTLVVHRGQLVAGGTFTHVGGMLVNRIARWDAAATSWEALGGGFNAFVAAVIDFQGDILAAGGFTIALEGPANGATPVNYVARFNGSQWLAVGSGLNSPGWALGAYHGNLVAGHNAAPFVSAFNGTEWVAIGDGLEHGAVEAITVLHDQIIAGGLFSHTGLPGYEAARHIARWDGVAGVWQPLAIGTDRPVYALMSFNGALFAGGDFNSIEDVHARRLARWDPIAGEWNALDLDFGLVRAFAVHGDDVIVGGWFGEIAGISAANIARWNGAAFEPLGKGVPGVVRTMCEYAGELIAANGPLYYFNSIQRWDGKEWHLLGEVSGLDKPSVLALAAYEGELFAGGSFTGISGVGAGRIARWNGSSWQPVGGGVRGQSGYVAALAVYNGDLFVGGSFTTAGGAGGISASNIARWDGSAWRALGAGFINFSVVRSLTVHHGKLIAGGNLTVAGAGSPCNIAVWDDESAAWQPLGSGTSGSVYAMAPFGDVLVVGGEFVIAGEFASAYLARWGPPEAVPRDTNCDGVVNFDDVLAIIFAFGDCAAPPAPCPADLDGNGTVNFDDILIVLFNWT